MASGALMKTVAAQILAAAYGLAALQLGGRQMRIAMFGTKKYERALIDEVNAGHRHELVYIEASLGSGTASLAAGFPAVNVFVNDVVDRDALKRLAAGGTKLVATRSTGFIHADSKRRRMPTVRNGIRCDRLHSIA